MDTLSLRIAYRPVRVGWCVRFGNMDDVRGSLRRTHTLWGGRYNPIIPIGGGVDGKSLIQRFRVDALYPAAEVPELVGFAESFEHLRWPGFHRPKEFFVETNRGFRPPFLDVSHAVVRLYEEYVKGDQERMLNAKIFSWHSSDPLADIFLAQFGSYPKAAEIGLDYEGFVSKLLKASVVSVSAEGPLPPDAFMGATPSTITMFDLEANRLFDGKDRGFYIGSAANFEDVVNFWNLRAANIDLYFFDVDSQARLGEFRDRLVSRIQEGAHSVPGLPPAVGIWSREQVNAGQLGGFGRHFSGGVVSSCHLHVNSPLMEFKAKSVLANVGESRGSSLVSVQLPEKPFSEDGTFPSPMVVVGIEPRFWFTQDPDKTLVTPFLPEMNEFYRKEMLLAGDGFRVQQGGFGIITTADTSEVSFYALQTSSLIAAVFRPFGIKAEPSLAGQIAKRIIHQLDGLQGCRPFKFSGVRKLIEEHGPFTSFTRGAATLMIAQIDPATKKPTMQVLFLEGKQLTPSSTFDYLLRKGVFRTGLELTCTNCGLQPWLSLESLGHEVVCEYCGEKFNVTPQLKDRDWRYRRSGLFGRDNHQEGAIPVVLTLQQLATNVHSMLGSGLFATSFKLSSTGAKINPCETDLVVLLQDISGNIDLLIGECKSGGSENVITEDDVQNLLAVSKSFPADRVSVYLLFSKLGSFSAAEISRCTAALDPHHPRVILLSLRELEPYHVYERTAKEFDIRSSAISLKDLAQATPRIFFQPKRKAGAGEGMPLSATVGEKQPLAPSTGADIDKGNVSADPDTGTGHS